MSSAARWMLWSLGLPLAVLGVISVILPSLVTPLIDDSVVVGGLPAGALFVGLAWLLIVVGGFAWIRLAGRGAPGRVASISMIVWTAVVLIVSPAVVVIVRNMKV